MVDALQAGDPQTLGRYRLIGRLGRGGMGTVYLGLNERNEQVAIKVINANLAGDPSFHNRFLREVAAARKVRRFCTAPVLDASLRERPLYVVTEYIDGPTLESAVTTDGPLHGSNLEGLAVGVATALNAIHDAGIVHRDLKPANVLLSGVGPRVIDFGIARAWEGKTGTKAGAYIGTPAYLAPELLRGESARPASDVFSWGCVVAFAGTGLDPFGGDSLHEILYRVANEAPMLYGLDGELQEIVEWALNKDPDRRPSVVDLLDNLIGRTGHNSELMPPAFGEVRSSATKNHPDRTPLPRPQLGTNSEAMTGSRTGWHGRGSTRIGIIGAAIACMLVLAFLVFQLWPDDSRGSARNNSGSSPAPSATPSPSVQAKDSSTAQPTSQGPQGGGDVDRRFLGKWTGLITHYGFTKSSYATTVIIDGGQLAEIVGRTENANNNCSGKLKLVIASRNRLVVEEEIVEGKENCEDVVLLTLTYQNDGSLKYEYKLRNSRGDGTLRK